MNEIHNWKNWIGTDESGKGDYFGPLVVAGVFVNPVCRCKLLEIGITDGKKISNTRIRKLANWMWNNYEKHIEVVEKMPDEYNNEYDDLINRGENSSSILANLHFNVIQSLSKRFGVRHALVDKFPFKDRTLLFTQRDLNIKHVTKGERDIAVAAASIIARDRFLTGMENLSDNYEIKLPRGASKVIETGRDFVKLNGEDSLRNVAKLHFRTTRQVIG